MDSSPRADSRSIVEIHRSRGAPLNDYNVDLQKTYFFLGMLGTVTLRILLVALIPALRWKATDLCFPTRRRSQSSEQYSR